MRGIVTSTGVLATTVHALKAAAQLAALVPGPSFRHQLRGMMPPPPDSFLLPASMQPPTWVQATPMQPPTWGQAPTSLQPPTWGQATPMQPPLMDQSLRPMHAEHRLLGSPMQLASSREAISSDTYIAIALVTLLSKTSATPRYRAVCHSALRILYPSAAEDLIMRLEHGKLMRTGS